LSIAHYIIHEKCQFNVSFLEIFEIFLEIREIADIMLEQVMSISDNPFKETIQAWKNSSIIKEEVYV